MGVLRFVKCQNMGIFPDGMVAVIMGQLCLASTTQHSESVKYFAQLKRYQESLADGILQVHYTVFQKSFIPPSSPATRIQLYLHHPRHPLSPFSPSPTLSLTLYNPSVLCPTLILSAHNPNTDITPSSLHSLQQRHHHSHYSAKICDRTLSVSRDEQLWS